MICLLIEEDNTLYPIEIKKTSSPTKEMARAFNVLCREENKKIACGVILSQVERKIYLSDNLIALPLEYI